MRKLVGAVVFVALAGCASSGSESAPHRPAPTTTITTTATTATTAAEPVTRVAAAGDIACRPDTPGTPTECQMAATADLVASLHPDVVMPLGDLQYELGRADDFTASYDATWGRVRSITRPVPGNHEYTGGRAKGYFGDFGDAAHPPDGWYSFDAGTWHVIVLNSVCAAVGGCGEGSRQYRWLQAELEATKSTCILAAWHHPRWSSGLHHSDDTYEPFWQLLAAHGADVVLSGHDHDYERFAPKQGLVQFVVGTGGRSLYPVGIAEVGSEVVHTSGFGVLVLTLRSDGYDWRFESIPGSAGSLTDEGSAGCR